MALQPLFDNNNDIRRISAEIRAFMYALKYSNQKSYK